MSTKPIGRYGPKSYLSLIIPLLLIASIRLLSKKYVSESYIFLITVVVLSIGYGFFFAKIVKVSDETLSIGYMINPFRNPKFYNLKDIRFLQVRNNSTSGTCHLIIKTEIEEEEWSMSMFGFEQRKLVKALSELGVNVEHFKH